MYLQRSTIVLVIIGDTLEAQLQMNEAGRKKYQVAGNIICLDDSSW